MLIRDIFRRTCAMTLAAAVLLSSGVLPLAGASGGAVLSFEEGETVVNTAAALKKKQNVSLEGWGLPESALAALNGYIAADISQQNGVVFVTAYRASVGANLSAPSYQFKLIAANKNGTDVTIRTVNGETPGGMESLGEIAHDAILAPALLDTLAEPAAEKETVQTPTEEENPPVDEQGGENKPAKEETMPEGEGDTPTAEGDTPTAEEKDPVKEEQKQEGETVQPENTDDGQQAAQEPPSVENKQEQNDGQKQEPSTEPQTPAAESQMPVVEPETSAAEPQTEGPSLAAAFGFRSHVIGPRAVLSGEKTGEGDSVQTGWTLVPGAVEGYSFTVAGRSGTAEVKLYGEGVEPSDPNAQTLPQPVDPQDVYGFRYDCGFDPNLSLGDLAGHAVSVDLSSFGKVFNLGELGGATGDTAVFSLTAGGASFAAGTITVDKESKNATIAFYDAATLQENASRDIAAITGVSAWFWMRCEYNKNGGADERPTKVELGGCEIQLDWAEIEAQQPACKIEKKEAQFDAATRVITWEIKLTPENGASLAGAELTDTLTEDEVSFVSLQVAGLEAVTGEELAALVNKDGKTLTYAFDANWEKNQGATVTVETAVSAQYFVSNYNQKSTITNTASIVNEAEEYGFAAAEDHADKTFNTTWMGKKGEYFNGAASSSIKWTISFNAPVNLTNVKVYDLLDPSMMYQGELANVKGAICAVLEVSNATDTAAFPAGLQADIAAIPDGQTCQLLVFTIDTLKAGAHTITFNTAISPFAGIDGTLNTKVVNKAYMSYTIPGGAGEGGGVSGETPGIISPAVDYVQAAIEKTGSYNRSTRCITWTINANNNKQALTGGVKIEDDLNKLLTEQYGWISDFVNNSIVWWKDGQPEAVTMQQFEGNPDDKGAYPETPAYTLVDNKLTIYVQEMDRETYHFSFQTKVIGNNIFKNDNAKATRSNTASLTWDGKTVSHTANVTVVSKYLVKEALANNGSSSGNGESYDPADNTLWWKIQINADGRNMTGAGGEGGPTVTDTLPDGVTYVGYALYEAKLNPSNLEQTNGYMSLKTLAEPLETNSVNAGALLEVTQNGRSVAFQFKNKIDAAADLDSSRYILYVKTRLDPEKLTGAAGKPITLKNTASITGQDSGHDLNATVSVNKTIKLDNLTKKGEQLFVDGKAVYEIKWTIDANLDGKANGLTDPTVTDTLPEGSTLKQQEDGRYVVSIQKLKNGKVTGGDLAYADGAPNGWTYEDGVFRFVLPNEAAADETARYSAYRIVLTTEIGAEYAGSVVKNSATLSATDKEIGSSDGTVQVRYFGAGASGSWDQPATDAKTLTVKKVSSAQTALGVAGARFEMYYSTSVDGDDFKRYGSGTTAADGTLVLRGLPADTERVKLVETQTPNGYLKPANPETIVEIQSKNQQATIQNDPFGGLTVIKRSAQTTTGADGSVQPGNLLAGAKFTLKKGDAYYDLAGKPVAAGSLYAFETDATGTIRWTGLPVGTYTLTETAAPSGYKLGAQSSWMITVAQQQDGTMTVEADGKTIENAELTVLNDKKESSTSGGNTPDPEKPGIEIEIPEEDTPLSPGVPTEDPQNPTDTDGASDDLIEIVDEETPKAAAVEEKKADGKKNRLPQTGGLTAGLLIPLGMLTMGAGALLQHRKKEDEE